MKMGRDVKSIENRIFIATNHVLVAGDIHYR